MTFETQIEDFGTTAVLRMHVKIWSDCGAPHASGSISECGNKRAASHPFYRIELNQLMHHSRKQRAVLDECEWKPDYLFHPK